MKNYAAVLIAVATLALSAGAFANHNSRFGDNTGRTVGGVHDNRIDNNTHTRDNRLTMDEAQFQVRSLGDFAQYMQGGHPATVIPGARR